MTQILILFCFVLHLTTPLPHPHFSFYFIFIYLFFSREKRPKQSFIGFIFFSRFFTACSEFAFDFSTLLGIFWTISGVFDSPLLGKVYEFCIIKLRTIIVQCVLVRSSLVAVHFDL